MTWAARQEEPTPRPGRRGHITRELWLTCAAVVLAQLATLPIAYVPVVLGLHLFIWAQRGGLAGFAFGSVILAAALLTVWLLAYGAGLVPALLVRHYRRGMHDLPVRRIAAGSVWGLVLGVVGLEILDYWELALRDLGLPDAARAVLSAALLLGGALAGARRGARDWARATEGRP